MKTYSLIAMLFLLSSCQAIGDFADSIGRHMPVIGKRCEHWQCVTESGQKASDTNKTAEQKPSNATNK